MIKIKVFYAKEYTPMQKEVLGFLRKQTYDETDSDRNLSAISRPESGAQDSRASLDCNI